MMLASAACIFVLSGCSGRTAPPVGPAPTQGAAFDTNGINMSKEARITGYLLGQTMPDMPLILEALNKKLKSDINAMLEVNYIKWGEVPVKYPLVLASGVDIDWIYTSNWNYYFTEAARGSFLELKTEMLMKYMPRHWAVTNPLAWDQARIDGKIFMVPTATPDKKFSVLLIREDLRKEYGVPDISRFTDLGPYLAAIKARRPDMVPMLLDNGFDIPACRTALMSEAGFQPGYICDGIIYNTRAPFPAILSLAEEPALSFVRQASTTMKAWYDSGYVNSNPFANEIRSKESFQEGKSAVGLGNLYDVAGNIVAARNNGYEVKIIPLLSHDGKFARDPYINNGAAIASTSRNPERALMCLDLIMEDPGCNYLVSFGIEGRNYTLTADDKISVNDSPGGVKGAFVLDQSGFWFTNKDQWKPIAEWQEEYIRLRETAEDYLFDHPLSTFAFNNQDVKTEMDQVSLVYKYYLDPLSVGAVEDIDEAIGQLIARMQSAGVGKVKAAVIRQVEDYLQQ